MVNSKIRFSVTVNDFALPGWESEHGLALWIEAGNRTFLFDTGLGGVLLSNLDRFGLEPGRLDFIVLSHGHNDHTGGLSPLFDRLSVPVPVYAAPGLTRRRWSLSPPVTAEALRMTPQNRGTFPPREISIPAPSSALLGRLSERGLFRQSGTPAEIAPGITLTGAIPRTRGEGAGGAFFFDPEENEPDPVADEQALLISAGPEPILVTGCCHAGLINTLEHCRRLFPDRPIRTVVGGLHLVHAGPDRLRQTAEYLESSTVKRIVPLHCTGTAGIEFLCRTWKSGRVEPHRAGEEFVL